MTVTLQEFSVPELKYAQTQLEKSYAYDVRGGWETVRPKTKKILDIVGRPIVSTLNEDQESYAVLYFINEGEGLALLDFSKRKLVVSIASSNKSLIDKHMKLLKKLYPLEPDQIDGKVKVRFWYNTTHGPKNVIRTIGVPKWGQIEKNYDPETYQGLKYLIEDFKPSAGGQLIIMNGVPGTGKSYYLRSLLHQWKDWCSAEYVLDPENLFSGGQGYMADLVLRNSYDEEYDYIEDDNDDHAGKWKLLILEDSGDLLTVDAKLQVGQPALSRLLNLVDGLIGQGLRVLVLITTNEDMGKMHEAVVRDGRCAAIITFNSLAKKQAIEWLGGSSKLPDGKTRYTLAELYALTKGKDAEKLIKESRGFGFRVPE